MVRRLKLDFWMAYKQTEQSILDRGYNELFDLYAQLCGTQHLRDVLFLAEQLVAVPWCAGYPNRSRTFRPVAPVPVSGMA